MNTFHTIYSFMVRIFGGFVADIKRRIPWYLDDFTNALHPQCFASFVFLYFAALAPIVTFGGLLGQGTENFMVCIIDAHATT